jgi:hypothetical protein
MKCIALLTSTDPEQMLTEETSSKTEIVCCARVMAERDLFWFVYVEGDVGSNSRVLIKRSMDIL